MKRLWVYLAALAGLWPIGCGKGGEAAATTGSEPALSGDGWCGATPCPCKAGTEMKVAGKTSACTLEKAMDVQGLPAAAKQVGFDKAGVLRQLVLSAPHTIGDVLCKPGSTVELWSPTKLRSCYTDEVVTLSDLACTKNISLTQEGKLRRCQLAKASKVGALDLPAQSFVTLYESGTPGRFELFDGFVEVQGHRCVGGFNYLYESGTLKRCGLAAAETVGDKTLKRGADVCFSEAGAIVPCKGLRFDKP